MQSILVKRKNAMTKYRQLKKQASKERVQFGKRLIKARAKERGTTVAAQERQLRNAFGQRKLAQRVKRLTGKQRGATLRSVNAPHPNNNGTRIECDDKPSIEEAFNAEGTRRFSQSNSTPLMDPDFVSRVGYLGELEGTEQILNGTFITPPDMDPFAAKFITQLKMDPTVKQAPLITKSISTKSYQESWKKMRPNTSCSPSGPEFVHYIAGSKDNDIAEFDATMANIPYASGYNPEDWTKFTDVLIPKKTASAAIEK
jgi:hypothetical protein